LLKRRKHTPEDSENDTNSALPPNSNHSATQKKADLWWRRAAVFQIAVGGMILIGFAVWILTNILPLSEHARNSSDWIIPVQLTISQPVGSAIAIIGGCIILKRKRRLGLYVSIAAIPILLINNTWIQFIGVVNKLILPLFLYNVNSVPIPPQVKAQFSFIYYVWFVIYNACVAAIGSLLTICWFRMRELKLKDKSSLQ